MPFIDNIWVADLADMQLISKFNKGNPFLLCVIGIYSMGYTWVIPLKDKKGITITKAFQKVLKESNRKPNKIWLDKWATFSKFYKRSIKSWLQKMLWKCIQPIMKENSLLLKDLLDHYKRKFLNIWHQYQKMCILLN